LRRRVNEHFLSPPPLNPPGTEKTSQQPGKLAAPSASRTSRHAHAAMPHLDPAP